MGGPAAYVQVLQIVAGARLKCLCAATLFTRYTGRVPVLRDRGGAAPQPQPAAVLRHRAAQRLRGYRILLQCTRQQVSMVTGAHSVTTAGMVRSSPFVPTTLCAEREHL